MASRLPRVQYENGQNKTLEHLGREPEGYRRQKAPTQGAADPEINQQGLQTRREQPQQQQQQNGLAPVNLLPHVNPSPHQQQQNTFDNDSHQGDHQDSINPNPSHSGDQIGSSPSGANTPQQQQRVPRSRRPLPQQQQQQRTASRDEASQSRGDQTRNIEMQEYRYGGGG